MFVIRRRRAIYSVVCWIRDGISAIITCDYLHPISFATARERDKTMLNHKLHAAANWIGKLDELSIFLRWMYLVMVVHRPQAFITLWTKWIWIKLINRDGKCQRASNTNQMNYDIISRHKLTRPDLNFQVHAKLTFANETRAIIIAHHFAQIDRCLWWTELRVCHGRQSEQRHNECYGRSHFVSNYSVHCEQREGKKKYGNQSLCRAPSINIFESDWLEMEKKNENKSK